VSSSGNRAPRPQAASSSTSTTTFSGELVAAARCRTPFTIPYYTRSTPCRRQGIVHRDLKPQNIFLDFNNNCKLNNNVPITINTYLHGTAVNPNPNPNPQQSTLHQTCTSAYAVTASAGYWRAWQLSRRRLLGGCSQLAVWTHRVNPRHPVSSSENRAPRPQTPEHTKGGTGRLFWVFYSSRASFQLVSSNLGGGVRRKTSRRELISLMCTAAFAGNRWSRPQTADHLPRLRRQLQAKQK